MSSERNSTRVRLIQAALELFAAQGVTETTTRQIAELAQVNEVTLFRQFGNKHGLLLAAIEDSAILSNLGESLVELANRDSATDQALKDCASDRIQALERVPEFVRSVIGEAGQFPQETRQALGRGLNQANRAVAQYLATLIQRGQLRTDLPAEKLASLLNAMLFGYVVIELTSEFHELWKGQDDFLQNMVDLFLRETEASNLESPASSASLMHIEKVADLPANLVRLILQRAKKLGLRDYALAYVLFASGLSVEEIVTLERSHQISDSQQHLLQVTQGAVRQVPVNQWIMGDRYGSYTRNPLSQWIKSRKDDQAAMFLNDVDEPISELEVRSRWQAFTEEIKTPTGQSPAIEQARQTWCVEMLMKGINLEYLSILSGWNSTQLQPYARRAKEKAALEQAIQRDRKA